MLNIKKKTHKIIYKLGLIHNLMYCNKIMTVPT